MHFPHGCFAYSSLEFVKYPSYLFNSCRIGSGFDRNFRQVPESPLTGKYSGCNARKGIFGFYVSQT